MAGALALLGVERALVVSSQDALDEMSISAPTTVVEVDGADLSDLHRRARRTVGLSTAADPDAVAGGSPQDNAAIARAIFAGRAGPRRDLAVLNAGAAIYAAGRADDIAAGVARRAGRDRRRCRARARSTRSCCARQLAERRRAGVNVLDRIVADTREDVRAPPRGGPAGRARARARRAAATTARSPRR